MVIFHSYVKLPEGKFFFKPSLQGGFLPFNSGTPNINYDLAWLRWGSADVLFRRKKVSSFLCFDQSPFFSPIGCSMTAIWQTWIWPCAVSISRYVNCSYGKNGSEWLENQLLTDLGQGLMVSSSLIHFNLNSAGCQNKKNLPSTTKGPQANGMLHINMRL